MKNVLLYAAAIGVIVIPFIATVLIALNFIINRKKNKSKKENNE